MRSMHQLIIYTVGRSQASSLVANKDVSLRTLFSPVKNHLKKDSHKVKLVTDDDLKLHPLGAYSRSLGHSY